MSKQVLFQAIVEQSNKYVKVIRLLLLTLIACSLHPALAQDKTSKKLLMDIREVEIVDSQLRTEIEKFVSFESSSDSTFKKLGYVTIKSFIPHEKDAIKAFHINKNWINFDDLANDQRFPLFYTHVAGRLVLFSFSEVSETIGHQFSISSKRKFQKIVEPYLFKPEKIEMVDDKGNQIKSGKYREGEKLQIHGGIDVIKFSDGSMKVTQTAY